MAKKKARAHKRSHAHKRAGTRKRAAKRSTRKASKRAAKKATKRSGKKAVKAPKKEHVIDTYDYKSKDIPITIAVKKLPGEYVYSYEVSISDLSPTTESILEKIRNILIDKVDLGIVDITDEKKSEVVEERFKETIGVLIERYFPESDDRTKGFLTTYLIQKSLGLGSLEILMSDQNLEEIVINSAEEPVWVYHKRHGWLKTNVRILSEEQTKHYSTTIARKVGRQFTVMTPLLDAHLEEGDRVNATMLPISTQGNTMTIRKFSRDPWTITKFLAAKTINTKAASLIWLAMQYELSALITGGTASGKTSTLNVLASFIPPNQRVLSIEDTRELRLPRFLHWVPLNTRQPNTEDRGEISMEDLLVNSLRMRPDRILVGEIRRKTEAETLFEAIHTGHSVYATFHANSAEETVDRITNPPIDVPSSMLPAISLIIVQFRNRRTGVRRTFQIAEILPDASAHVLMQYDVKKDTLVEVSKSKSLLANLMLFTGMTRAEMRRDLAEKEAVLAYLVKHDISTVDGVGRVMAEYYTDKATLMRYVRSGKKLPAMGEGDA